MCARARQPLEHLTAAVAGRVGVGMGLAEDVGVGPRRRVVAEAPDKDCEGEGGGGLGARGAGGGGGGGGTEKDPWALAGGLPCRLLLHLRVAGVTAKACQLVPAVRAHPYDGGD